MARIRAPIAHTPCPWLAKLSPIELYAFIRYTVYMLKHLRQYTLRKIPDEVDRALKRRARETGKSFNQVAVEALTAGAGESLVPKRDFGEIIGSLTAAEADVLEGEIQLQHQIDTKLWSK